MNSDQNQFPFWLGGILIALVLIIIGTRVGSANNSELSRLFVPRPTAPGAPTPQSFQLPQVKLPELPPNVQRTITGVRDRLAGGNPVPALTPVASGPRLRVEVQQVQRSGDTVTVHGNATNIANTAVELPSTAFSFRDSAGVTYALPSSNLIKLEPGQSTTLDLSVPLPDKRGLTLVLALPPDPLLEQVLIVETK